LSCFVLCCSLPYSSLLLPTILASFRTYFTHLFVIINVRNTYSLATRTSTLDYNSILLYVIKLCAPYIFILCLPKAPHISSDRYRKRTLSILVPPPHRYHKLATGYTNSCFVIGKNICKSLWRSYHFA
jgi:hypothetical protein